MSPARGRPRRPRAEHHAPHTPSPRPPARRPGLGLRAEPEAGRQFLRLGSCSKHPRERAVREKYHARVSIVMDPASAAWDFAPGKGRTPSKESFMMRAMKLLVVCVVLLAATPVLAANLIVNGSFENPIVPSGSFINYLGGSTAITGWTVVGVDSSIVSGTFVQSGITFQAQDGNQWIDLAGVTSNSMTSGVTQNISTTIDQSYDVTFYVGSTTDNTLFFPATVDLSINGGAACITPIPFPGPTC